MHVCFTKNIGGFDITLCQHKSGKFQIVYGCQVKDGLTYSEAAHELGSCIMHALACDGNVHPYSLEDDHGVV